PTSRSARATRPRRTRTVPVPHPAARRLRPSTPPRRERRPNRRSRRPAPPRAPPRSRAPRTSYELSQAERDRSVGGVLPGPLMVTGVAGAIAARLPELVHGRLHVARLVRGAAQAHHLSAAPAPEVTEAHRRFRQDRILELRPGPVPAAVRAHL